MLDLTIMATVQNGLNAVAGAHDALAAAKAAGLDAQSALLAAEDRKKETDAAVAQAEGKLLAAKQELTTAIETAFPSPSSSATGLASGTPAGSAGASLPEKVAPATIAQAEPPNSAPVP